MVRLPVIGTYKLEVNGGLVEFQIVCEHVPSDIRPLPPSSENGHGFTEQAAAAGLSEPSHILSYLLTSDDTLNAAIVDKDKQVKYTYNWLLFYNRYIKT